MERKDFWGSSHSLCSILDAPFISHALMGKLLHKFEPQSLTG